MFCWVLIAQHGNVINVELWAKWWSIGEAYRTVIHPISHSHHPEKINCFFRNNAEKLDINVKSTILCWP